MKPITYWIQNEAIDQLVKEYGSTLEKLSPGLRRMLIACLADENNFYMPVHGDDHRIVSIFQPFKSLTRHEKDLLIEAIAASLTQQGNPWVEGAKKMVAIAQRTEAVK